MNGSILIVEDEMLIALEMQYLLEEAGHDVLGIAADLESALSHVDRQIDLALVDLNLRDGLTGPQIGERLAAEHNAAVLFVTANPRLLGEGVSGTIGVLTKPTDEDSLVGAVRYGLRRRSGESPHAPSYIRCFS